MGVEENVRGPFEPSKSRIAGNDNQIVIEIANHSDTRGAVVYDFDNDLIIVSSIRMAVM